MEHIASIRGSKKWVCPTHVGFNVDAENVCMRRWSEYEWRVLWQLPLTWATKSMADAYEIVFSLMPAVFRSPLARIRCFFFFSFLFVSSYQDYGVFHFQCLSLSAVRLSAFGVLYNRIRYSWFVRASFIVLFNCFFEFSPISTALFLLLPILTLAGVFYTIYSISFICINKFNVHHCIKCGNYWKRPSAHCLCRSRAYALTRAR